MKKITTIIFALLIMSGDLLAANYSIDTKNIWARAIDNTDPIEMSSHQLNTSDKKITIMYKKVKETMPNDWTTSLCDNVGCYDGLPETGEMVDIEPLSEGLLKVAIVAKSKGEALVKYVVWEKGTTTYDTITFNVYSAGHNVKIGKAETSIKLNIYPNPTKGSFSFTKTLNKEATVSIFDLTGKKIKDFSAIEIANNKFNIRGMKTGIYLIRIKPSPKKGAVTKKIVKK